MASNPELRTEDLGARVRAVRELKGAEQRDVAKAAGMSRRDLQAAERGVKRLSSRELAAVAVALGIDRDVLVGIGFDGELSRAGGAPSNGHVADDELPPSLPTNLPNPEGRRDHDTHQYIERSWREVRAEMGDTLTSCARLVSAGSGDDVRRLIDRLERDLQNLEGSQAFQRKLGDHERALHGVLRSQTESLPDERSSTRL